MVGHKLGEFEPIFLYLVISTLVWQAAFMVFSAASPRQRIKDWTKYQIAKMEQMKRKDHVSNLEWKRGIYQPWTESRDLNK